MKAGNHAITWLRWFGLQNQHHGTGLSITRITNGLRRKVPVRNLGRFDYLILVAIKIGMVPRRGLEPPRLAAQVPETCASTNSAIWATESDVRGWPATVNWVFEVFLTVGKKLPITS